MFMQPFYGLTHMGYIDKKCNRPSQNAATVGGWSFPGRPRRDVLLHDGENASIRRQIKPITFQPAREAVAGQGMDQGSVQGQSATTDVKPD
jgi:hypothetical protein